MMHASPLASTVVLRLGPVGITQAVVTTWAVMAVLTLAAWLLTRRRSDPARPPGAAELLVTALLEQIREVVRADPRPLLPLLGTLFLLLLAANLSGLVPGLKAPTANLETPAALALIVFCAVHVHGVHTQGLKGYLASFARPKLIMLPLNVLSEITRTLSLTVRLFGNIMSGEFLIALVLALAGLFVPIPLMALELLMGVVQAYIFTVLATVFIGAASGEAEQP